MYDRGVLMIGTVATQVLGRYRVWTFEQWDDGSMGHGKLNFFLQVQWPMVVSPTLQSLQGCPDRSYISYSK